MFQAHASWLRILGAVSTSGVLAFLPTSSLAQSTRSFATVRWDTSRAIIAGSDCRRGVNSFITSSGSEVRIILRGVGIDIDGPELSGRSACSVRIPVEIPQGYYVSRVTQRLPYYAFKTRGARGSLVMAVNLFGQSVTSLSKSLSYNVYQPRLSSAVQRTTTFSRSGSPEWVSSFCNSNRSRSGLFALSIAASGQLDDAQEELTLMLGQSQPLVSFQLSRCL